jgi:hypothetical protein
VKESENEGKSILLFVFIDDFFDLSMDFFVFSFRGTRRKISLPIYAEDESNDLSDLGIGTSSASCKSSVSEDYDNNSVIVSLYRINLENRCYEFSQSAKSGRPKLLAFMSHLNFFVHTN